MFRRIPWQDVCKFLAGAFFVSAGTLFYLYLARVSVPILGTGFTATPEVSGARSIERVVRCRWAVPWLLLRNLGLQAIGSHWVPFA
jgi:hypothetical protein